MISYLPLVVVKRIHGFTVYHSRIARKNQMVGYEKMRIFNFRDSPLGKIHGESRNLKIRSFTDSRIHGITDSRIHGFTDSRIHGFTDSRIHGLTDSRTHGFADVWHIGAREMSGVLRRFAGVCETRGTATRLKAQGSR